MAKSLQSSNKNTGIISVLIGIVCVLIAVVVYTNYDKIFSNNGNYQTENESITGSIIINEPKVENNLENQEEGYFVGQQLELTGKITEKGNISNYTQLFETENGEIFGLKSSNIDLANISGEIKISGIVDNIKDNIYILDVSSLTFLKKSENEKNIEVEEQIENTPKEDINYLKNAGLFIHNISGTNIDVDIDHLNEKITLKEKKSTDGDLKSLEISYFKCSEKSNDTNCKYLKKTFENVSSVDYTTNDGDQFYGLVDLNGRFGTVGNFGYYIQTDDKIFLINIMQHVQFLSENYIKNLLLDEATKICNDGKLQIKYVEKIEISTKGEKYVANIDGKDISQKKLKCNIEVDPTIKLGGKLLSLEENKELSGQQLSGNNLSGQVSSGSSLSENEDKLEDENNSEKQEEINKSLLEKKENIEQFKLGKTFDFTARQGYTITFPSKNIRFSSSNVKENLGYNELYCYVKMNIIKYSNDETANKKLVETNPDTQIYVCNKKDELVEDLKKEFFVQFIDSDDKKMFLIKPTNPAWFDFANGIVIK